MPRITIDLDDDLYDRLEEESGSGDLEAFVESAIREKLGEIDVDDYEYEDEAEAGDDDSEEGDWEESGYGVVEK